MSVFNGRWQRVFAENVDKFMDNTAAGTPISPENLERMKHMMGTDIAEEMINIEGDTLHRKVYAVDKLEWESITTFGVPTSKSRFFGTWTVTGWLVCPNIIIAKEKFGFLDEKVDIVAIVHEKKLTVLKSYKGLSCVRRYVKIRDLTKEAATIKSKY